LLYEGGQLISVERPVTPDASGPRQLASARHIDNGALGNSEQRGSLLLVNATASRHVEAQRGVGDGAVESHDPSTGPLAG
jgi:hypothetical protein